MNIVFFGTSHFAARILESLLKHSFTIKAIVTRTDKPQGRNLALLPSPVKAFAQKNQLAIPVLQPMKASTEEFKKVLESFEPDLFVVVAYGEIIKKSLLELPKWGNVNVHPSLLPKYRGPAPIHHALLNGDKETGVCIIDVAEAMDAGDIFAQEKIAIEREDNFETLENKLFLIAEKLLLQVLIDFQNGKVQRIAQDHTRATLAPKITAESEKIHWSKSAKANFNLIRALSPKPGAWCFIENKDSVKRLKILKANLHPEQSGYPGEILQQTKTSLVIACQDGALEILEVQPEGKKKIAISDFLNGLQAPLKLHLQE